MYLSPRDRKIVTFLAQFQQATAEHIHDEIFSDLASRTPCHRALTRLMGYGIIARTQHRIVGGSHGGSGRYVYLLDTIGLRMSGLEKRNRTNRPNFHTLEIVDIYQRLKSLGGLTIWQTEPTCWRTIGGVELHPDMYVEFHDEGRAPLRAFVEADMGTEGQRQLRGKLEAYYRAFDGSAASEFDDNYPGTIWVVPDDNRVNELRWLIGQMPNDAQPLFTVTTLAQLVEKS